jgi:membrane protease YdiL (CAAX protease family)
MPLIFPEAPSQLFILGSTLVGMLLPALVITRIADGREGNRRLWARILKVRIPLVWYAFALLVLPVPAIIMALLFFGGPDAGTSVPAAVLYGYVVQGVIVLVTNNLWEEVAVMGFLQARLQDRQGPMRAVVFTALFFTFQHISLIIASGSAAVLLAFFFVTALGFRALIGWTYTRTDSLFIVGLLHAASNAATGGSGFFGSGVIGRLYESQPFATVLHLVAALIVGLALVAATRGRLGRGQPSATEALASQST